MKKLKIKRKAMKAKKYILSCIMILFFPLLDGSIFSQDEINPRLSLTYLKQGDSQRILKVRVTARVDRQLIFVKDVKVDFYHSEPIMENLIGQVITDENGNGLLTIPESFKEISDTANAYIFHAVLENQPGYGDASRDIEIVDARLTMEFDTIDSIKTVMISVLEKDDTGEEIPVEDAELKVFVKRQFGDLPITKDAEYSDENGNVEVEFPNDLPGDHEGKILVIARIDDSDDHGSLEVAKEIDWGIIPQFDDKTLKRSLWATGANAPLELLFFVNALIVAVWGIIFYIIYQIYKIYKLA